MKIEGNSPNVPRPEDVSADRSRNARSDGAAASGSRDDRVDVSPLAVFVGRTIEAAAEAPAVRSDAVARAQEKLAAGEVGQDPQKLADRINDHLLGD